MVKNKLKCSFRHRDSAYIDIVRVTYPPLIVSKSTPSRAVWGQNDSAHIDTPSRVCHRHRFFLALFSKQNLSPKKVKSAGGQKRPRYSYTENQ